MEGFFVGKKNALYRQRENGSLSRFGIRLSPTGIQVFDQLLRRWYNVPNRIPIRSGGHIVIEVNNADAAKDSILHNPEAH